MALTAAERQARYRQRHLQEGDRERLQLVVSLQAKRALERLARHHGVTLAALLERLALEEQGRITAGMDGDQYRAYVGE